MYIPLTTLLLLGTTALAAPTPQSTSYIDLIARTASPSSLNTFANAFCDPSRAQLPTTDPSLPSPPSNLTVYQVALGRGTQNYTCADSTSSSTPASIGAVATLFNATCMASNSPALLSLLPSVALNLPVPDPSNPLSAPALSDLSGHHYFINQMTTPYFNLDTPAHEWGQGAFKKAGSAASPPLAIKGQFGLGNGAVAWLALGAETPESTPFQMVYRVNTAGGNPPATCEGMPATFEVQYAAEYWFYA